MPESKKTDSVAFLFETQQLTNDQIESVKAFINRELASKLTIATYQFQVKRFDSSNGGVTIYQP
jgi:ribosomal protein L16/L10AE